MRKKAAQIVPRCLLAWIVMLGGCLPSSSHNANMHYQEGRSIKKVDPERAREFFEKALREDPKLADAHLELGYLYEGELEDPNAAIYHFRRYLELEPNSPLKESTIEPRIANCLQDLTREGTLQRVIQQMENDLQTREQEIERLKERVQQLEAKLETARKEMLALTTPKSHSPGASEAPPDQEAESSLWINHTVEADQTIYALSKMYGVTEKEILKLNPKVNPRALHVGDVIRIPKN